MQLCIRGLVCLSFFIVLLAVASMASDAKPTNCCTKIGMENITAPIIGYRIQRKNLPCIRAVIFETTEGRICSHWRQDWVFEKIRELEQARRVKQRTKTATSAP